MCPTLLKGKDPQKRFARTSDAGVADVASDAEFGTGCQQPTGWRWV